MRPTLTPGDRLLVVRRRRYRVGDVVALRDPRDGATILKRIATITGDAIEVAGDNATASTDSRTFGPVHASTVLGQAVYRYAPTARAGRLR
jgi:nickel-type superoxide dismutase maturation protease